MRVPRNLTLESLTANGSSKQPTVPGREHRNAEGTVKAIVPIDPNHSEFVIYDVQFDFGTCMVFRDQLEPASHERTKD